MYPVVIGFFRVVNITAHFILCILFFIQSVFIMIIVVSLCRLINQTNITRCFFLFNDLWVVLCDRINR
ncbi:hypothetical protein XENTR_v10021335 [Xenopus tropicalis]|nr:hypothetical protein XENTR_v10021335 [Xenopus tropicalis]